MGQQQRNMPFVLVILGSIAASFILWKMQPEVKISSPEDFVKVDFHSRSRVPASVGDKTERKSRLLFQVKEGATGEQTENLDRALKRFGFKTTKKFLNEKVHKVEDGGEGFAEDAMIREISATGAVDFVEADRDVKMAYTPNDPNVQWQWHLGQVKAFGAWDITMGTGSVTVANCDTGVESSHPDLYANLILPGYNSMDSTTNSDPVHPHGTMTAGAIAATADNWFGIAGVAPNVKILPIRISNSADGASSYSAMASCIEYAANRGVKVVNMSYEGAESATIDAAATYLRSKGGLLVMAAGNAGADRSAYPDYSSFIIVSATDQNNSRPSWSNYGTPTDIAAPGTDILTTSTQGNYVYVSGTSLAAPVVSAVAAMIYSLKPSFTPTEVENFIFNSATRLGSGANDINFGNGLVNAEGAISLAKASIAPPAEPSVTKVSGSVDYATLQAGQMQVTRVTLASATRLDNLIVEMRVYNSANQMIDTKSFTPMSLDPSVNTSLVYNYQSPTTLPLGSYYVIIGVWNSDWTVTYLWSWLGPFSVEAPSTAPAPSPVPAPAPAPTPTPPPPACNYPDWAQAQNYSQGSTVRYAPTGKFYRAKKANTGNNPSSSPKYWSTFNCP